MDLSLYCCSIDPVVFFVSTHETDVDDTELILDGYHNTVRVALDVEDNPIVSDKARIPVDTLDFRRRFPMGSLEIRIPGL